MSKYFVGELGIWADNDRFIKEVLIGEEYNYLHKYDTVLDIGANIGTFSFWIYPRAKRIYAVEPNPHAVELLKKTVADNNLDKMCVIEGAVTATNGNRDLINSEDDNGQYGGGSIGENGIQVSSYSLDRLFEEHNIEYLDLMKVDIEGGEAELFESEGFSNVASKIGTIIGEYHDGDRRAKIVRAMSYAGFRYIDQGIHFIAKRI